MSRSAYYNYLARPASRRKQRDQEILRALISLHQKYPVLGLDSLYALLRPTFRCGRERVRRLMKQANIRSKRHKAYKQTTNSNHKHPVAPNLLGRNFNSDIPNAVWVGDITYIPTGEGWLYLAIVKDLHLKKVVGYALSNRIDTQLTLDALHMAMRRQRPKAGLIFHSDRGVQYASTAFRKACETYKVKQSMARKGDPYDNAVAESFFSSLKCECVHLAHFQTRRAAKLEIFRYIEAFYNAVRPHSAIGWTAPIDFEATCKRMAA